MPSIILTPYQKIYDAFLAQIDADDWDNGFELDSNGDYILDVDDNPIPLSTTLEDWRQLLEIAIPNFMLPRVSFLRNNEGFYAELGAEEIQILAAYMRIAWLNRCINSWKKIGNMYDERDFSPAMEIRELRELLITSEEKAKKLLNNYARSVTNTDGTRSPFDYTSLAGDNI